MLLYEAKRKPFIADLIDRLNEFSDDDIDAMKLPLPWYKKALKEYRKELYNQEDYKEIIARILPNIVDGFLPDKPGICKIWRGNNQFIEMDRGHLEIKPNELIWFPDDGFGVWIDTTFSKKIDNRLLNLSEIGKMTKTEYTAKRREIRNNQHLSSSEIKTNEEDRGFFRIIRH